MTAPPSHDHRALWLKAKLFINRTLEPGDNRSFDERALWASLALELLGKAALSRVSPLLIADPREDGETLLIASGLIDGDARFVAVSAKTIWKRCAKAFKPFNELEALRISDARNEYLHGGGVGFLTIPEGAWWARYWAQTTILVNALDETLESFVGWEHVEVVERHLAQNKRNIENRVEMLIERAQQRLAQIRSGTVPARIADEWRKRSTGPVGLMYSTEASCPACGSLGTLEGEDVQQVESKFEQLSEDDADFWSEITVGSDYFSCENCRLELDNYDLISETDLPLTFDKVDDSGLYREPEYGND